MDVPGARVHADLHDVVRLAAAVARHRPGRLGAVHAPVLAPARAARPRRGLRRGSATWSLDGATAYVERNWGNGFPPVWWWGEAHDFGGDPVTVAFAGGPALGPLHATAVVVHLGGRLVRLGEPLIAGVRADVAPGRWVLRGRSLRHRVEIEATGDPAAAHVLDVPVPGRAPRASRGRTSTSPAGCACA